jgi:cytidyltransferase-like protein|tara:strand:+ start:25 stop:357 length:333 start_codon:yes stop_codon:yes gene_type:complete
MIKKIISIENLKKIVLRLKVKRKKIVLCHDVFDLLHIEHINHFEEAKSYGDIVIVSVASDKYVNINKGPNRPAFSEQNRLNALAALKAIEHVLLNRTPTAALAIKKKCIY